MLKGYYLAYSYMGWIQLYQKYMPFASETDYREYVAELEE